MGDRRLFIEPAAVIAPICRRIRDGMDAGAPEAADVLGDAFVRDPRARRALEIDVDEATLRLVEEQLESARAAIEAFFDTPLGDREGASLLRYPAGGFYGPHVDRARLRAWPAAERRRIAVILFLNTSREADANGEFSGGALRVHADGESWVDVHPRAGTVVAFPADATHEVTVVRHGVRDAAIDWFYGLSEGRPPAHP